MVPGCIDGDNSVEKGGELILPQGEDHEVREGEEETEQSQQMEARGKGEDIELVEEEEQQRGGREELDRERGAEVDHRIVLETVRGGEGTR
jgi:hypothetical protein